MKCPFSYCIFPFLLKRALWDANKIKLPSTTVLIYYSVGQAKLLTVNFICLKSIFTSSTAITDDIMIPATRSKEARDLRIKASFNLSGGFQCRDASKIRWEKLSRKKSRRNVELWGVGRRIISAQLCLVIYPSSNQSWCFQVFLMNNCYGENIDITSNATQKVWGDAQ